MDGAWGRGAKIGILGGTFDPVHQGHLTAALMVRERFELDEVLLLPAARPPHKGGSPITSFGRRLAMLELAVAGLPGLSVCALEGERPGPSFTIDTLRALRQGNGPRLYFIIGLDAFADIYTWKEYDLLPDEAHLVVLNRPGCLIPAAKYISEFFPAFSTVDDGKSWQAAGVAGEIYVPVMEAHAVSSSMLRTAVAAGRDISALTPAAVVVYIVKNQLYQDHEGVNINSQGKIWHASSSECSKV